MNEINRRIDEIADVAKWIISAHGTTDLKIQDALRLTRDDLSTYYGAEQLQEYIEFNNGNRIKLGTVLIHERVERVWFGNTYQDVKLGKPVNITRPINFSSILDGPIELLPHPPKGTSWWLEEGPVFSTDMSQFTIKPKLVNS